MKIIDDNKVVVNNANEFKMLIESNNNYSTYYLDCDIFIEGIIDIPEDKKLIIIDGTYNEKRNSLEVSFNCNIDDIEIDLLNLNIINDSIFINIESKEVYIKFENIKFNGKKLINNTLGITDIINSEFNCKSLGDFYRLFFVGNILINKDGIETLLYFNNGGLLYFVQDSNFISSGSGTFFESEKSIAIEVGESSEIKINTDYFSNDKSRISSITTDSMSTILINNNYIDNKAIYIDSILNIKGNLFCILAPNLNYITLSKEALILLEDEESLIFLNNKVINK